MTKEGPIIEVLVCGRNKTYSSDQLNQLLRQAGGGSVSFVCADQDDEHDVRRHQRWRPGGVGAYLARLVSELPEVSDGDSVNVIAHWSEGVGSHAYEIFVSEAGHVADRRAVEDLSSSDDRLQVSVYLPFELS